jgi:hypothetical protein
MGVQSPLRDQSRTRRQQVFDGSEKSFDLILGVTLPPSKLQPPPPEIFVPLPKLSWQGGLQQDRNLEVLHLRVVATPRPAFATWLGEFMARAGTGVENRAVAAGEAEIQQDMVSRQVAVAVQRVPIVQRRWRCMAMCVLVLMLKMNRRAIKRVARYKSQQQRKKRLLRCAICSGEHFTSTCPQLHGPKPAATFCGLAGDGLGFFQIPSDGTTTTLLPDGDSVSALITVIKGVVNADLLKAELSRILPVEWDWEIKEQGEKSYIVPFPCKSELDRMELS